MYERHGNAGGVPIPDKALFRVAEVAAICSVHPDTVRRWIKEGKLKPIYLPYGRLRVARAALDDILKDAAKGTDLEP